MRAASPLIVVLVVFSWVLPAHAGAKTPIPAVDRVVRKTVPPRTDPVSDLRREVEAVSNTISAVVQRALAPTPDVAVTSAPAVVSTPRRNVVADSSPRQSAGKRSGAGSPKTRARSAHGRNKERDGSSSRQDRDTRQPDKRYDLHEVADAGNEIHPTEVKGLTLTASAGTLLAATGVYLLTWMGAALFLIGLGALSLLSSRSRFGPVLAEGLTRWNGCSPAWLCSWPRWCWWGWE
jgi:hypothetical protein